MEVFRKLTSVSSSSDTQYSSTVLHARNFPLVVEQYLPVRKQVACSPNAALRRNLTLKACVSSSNHFLASRASRKQRGIDRTQPHQSAASAGGERDARDGREAREDERNAHGERRYHNTTGDGEERVPEWSRGVQKMWV